MPEGQGSSDGAGNGQGTGQNSSTDGSTAAGSTGQGSGASGGQASTVPENFDPERAMATILAQRESESRLKQQLQQVQSQLQQFQDRDKTELQRAQEERDRLKAELDETRRNAQQEALKGTVSAAAAKLGFVAPDLAHRLIDLDKLAEKDGKPDVEGELRKLLQQYPTLAVAGSGDGGAGGRPPGRKGDMNAIIRGSRS